MKISVKLWSRLAWVIIACIFAIWWNFPVKSDYMLQGTLLTPPRAIPSFNLTGMDGQAFNNQSLHGQWTMLFFGFTHCDSVCPLRLMALAKMRRLLEKQHAPLLPNVVMVSLDPERDIGPRLTSYVQAFHPSFYSATGSTDTLSILQNAWGISSDKVMRRNSTDGLMLPDIEHSSTIMVFNPSGLLVAFLTGQASADQLASDFLYISTTRNK